MSNNITLSAGIRQNLLSLQNTADLISMTQNRLATGKKATSALDNPTNFFTSASLNDRATDLNALLDSIGQAQQTLKAADQGITSLTNLVQSAKSIATQAEQATKGTVNYTNITGSVAIAADTTQALSPNAFSSSGLVANTQADFVFDTAHLSSLAHGDTFTAKLGSGATQTLTYRTAGAVTANGEFGNASDLKTVLQADFGAGNVTGTTTLTVSGTDVTSNFTLGGTVASTLSADITNNNANSSGSTITVNDGTHTGTFYYVASGAVAANGTFTDNASLVSAINNGASGVHSTITASAATGNKLQLDAAGSVGITVGGTVGTNYGFAATAYQANFNTTLNALSGNLTVKVGNNTTSTLSIGTGNGQIHTRAGLNTALAALTDITGSVNGAGNVNLAPTSSDNVTIGGDSSVVTGLRLAVGTTHPTGTVVTASWTRPSLQTQYNALLIQIDQLANDSSYNGINLLAGDSLKVVFNEDGTSSLTIQGVKFNSTGLGLSAISGNGFQDNHNIDLTLHSIDTALATLRAQASAFGSNESTVQTRQDFTKNLINTLQTGSDYLVLADP